MKSVYLHIGNFKTGTTAIQSYCGKYRKALRQAGYEYIKAGQGRWRRSGHSTLSLSLLQKYGGKPPDWYTGSKPFQIVAHRVRKEIEQSDCPNILISSEEFYRLAGFSDKHRSSLADDLRNLFRGYEVRVIMYVRPPVEISKSWYNQLNKGPAPQPRFIDHFARMSELILLPQANAKFWRDTFGTDSLILESYNGQATDHIKRFFDIIGCQAPVSESRASARINARANDRRLEKYRLEKIYTFIEEPRRGKFISTCVLNDQRSRDNLETKVQRINRLYEKFCQAESLRMDFEKLSLDDLLSHEEKIHPKEMNYRHSRGRTVILRTAHSLRQFYLRFRRSVG